MSRAQNPLHWCADPARLRCGADEQQQAAIKPQLRDSTYFAHASAFAVIRKGHDALYKEKFEDEADRVAIEALNPPDRFKREDGTFDPQMRQRPLGVEDRFVQPSEKPAPESTTLVRLNEEMQAGFLEKLGVELNKLSAESKGEDVDAAIAVLTAPKK